MGFSGREPVCFAPFRLDWDAGSFSVDGQEIQLRPKLWEVLGYLVAHRSQVVSVNELLDACWRDLHVGPNALSNVIYALRSMLSSAGGDPHWLQTVRGRGYRFAPPIPGVVTPQAEQTHLLAEPVAEGAELFVGRQPEIALLEQRWRQVRDAQSRFVLIAGEPGIGKSTLITHFISGLQVADDERPFVVNGLEGDSSSLTRVTASRPTASLASDFFLCVGRCPPQHRESEPYMAVLEAIGSLASMGEVIEIARQQAPTWLVQMPWLLPKEEIAALRQSLADAGSTRMLREGKRLLTALAARAPLLLVLEDVHWADSATVDLIRALAESDNTGRLMLIATYRPSEIVVQDHPLRSLVGELPFRTRNTEILMIGSLSPTLVEEYLDLRLANPALATEIAPLMEEKSGGNPLFLAAITDYLFEQERIVSGPDGWHLATALRDLEVGLPDGLREMIRTQLRQRGASEIRLLQAASAAGMDFTTLDVAAALEMAAAEAEEVCENLALDGYFIRAVGQVHWPDGSGGEVYRFAHAAYHQALVDDTPPSRRRLLHGRIGLRLEAAFGKRVREIAPRLANHFEANGDLERQAKYLKLSVQLAAGRYAHRETLAYVDRTIEVLGHLPTSDEQAIGLLGWQIERSNLVMGWKGYAAGYDSFARAIELARRQKSSLLEFICYAGCCMSGLMGRKHRDQARTDADRLLALAADGHPELMALAHVLTGCVRDSFGNPEAALAHAESALAALPNAILGIPRGFDLETLIHVLMATCLTRLGQLERSRQSRAIAIRTAETKAGLAGQAHAFSFLACDALIAGDPATALALAQRAIETAREGGFDYFMAAGEAALEAATIALAPPANVDPDGLTRLAATIERRRQLDENWYNMLFAGYLAEGYRRRGELGRAMTQIDSTFAEAELVYVPELWRIKGQIAATARKDWEQDPQTGEAERCIRSAVDLARKHGSKLFELRSLAELARLCPNDTTIEMDLAAARDSFDKSVNAPG